MFRFCPACGDDRRDKDVDRRERETADAADRSVAAVADDVADWIRASLSDAPAATADWTPDAVVLARQQ